MTESKTDSEQPTKEEELALDKETLRDLEVVDDDADQVKGGSAGLGSRGYGPIEERPR